MLEASPVVPSGSRPATSPRTYGPRSTIAAVLAVLVIVLMALCLIAFKHSLSLSGFTITGQPKEASFDVYRCGSSNVYRTGRTDASGTARVHVPFGCWDARPEPNDVKAFIARPDQHAPSTDRDAVALVLLSLVAVGSLALLWPAGNGVRRSVQARTHRAGESVIEARIAGDEARQWASYTFGFGAAATVLAAAFWFLSLANGAVRTPFFRFSLMSHYFGEVLNKFGTNVALFLVAEVVVLVWGLLVAMARLAPGRAGRPVRALAVFYIDLFRGIPAVVVLTLIAFGLRRSKVPGLSTIPFFWYGVISLSLTYGAYVAEVYRSGIDSIHPSQTAAARSLGLSYGRTLQHVVVPQAVRRIIPPLLNDFIGLQKDTALVSFVGITDALNQARIINSVEFNLSAITLVAVFFYVITVPQARFVDYLIRRDQARMRAGG